MGRTANSGALTESVFYILLRLHRPAHGYALMKDIAQITDISSQVGCPLACAFCATGSLGFTRNLTPGEILGQFLMMERRRLDAGAEQGINNIVFMGMGEPLLNADSVFGSIRMLNHPKMRGLGARHITISTSGVVQGIVDLADFEIPIRLSVSLHAPNDALRSRLMPINRSCPLSKLVEALHLYRKRTGERVTIEYALIDGVNDDPQLAYEMAALLDLFMASCIKNNTFIHNYNLV